MKPLQARLLLFCLIGVLATSLGISSAHAADPPVLVAAEVRPILGESAGGSWTEIVVTFQGANVTPLRGTLELLELDHRNSEERVIDRRPVDLLASPSSRIHIPALAGQSYRVRFLDDHQAAVWERSVSPQRSGQRSLVFTFGVDAPSLPQQQQRQYETSVVSLQALPRSAWTYDDAALFFVDKGLLGSIDEPACAALLEWIHAGGSLVIVEPDLAAQEDLQPWQWQPRAETTRCALPVLALGEERSVGSGRVLATNKTLLASEVGQLNSLLNASLGRRTSRASAHDMTFIGQTDRAPRVAAGGVLVFALGAVVGPVFFMHLRRRKKTTRLLPMLLGASVVGFLAMIGLGRAFAPKPHTTTTVVRDFTSGESKGRVVATRVFHGPSGPVRTKRAMEGSLLGENEHEMRGVFRLEPDDTIVLNERRPAVTDFVYLVESAPDRLAGPITLTCASDACTIENASGTKLERARIYISNRSLFYDVGTIEGHEKRSVRLENPTQGRYSSEPDERYALRSGARVSLIAWQAGAAEPTTIGVACVTGCEATR